MSILIEEKRKLEEQLELAKYELRIAGGAGYSADNITKRVDLNKINPIERLYYFEALKNYKTKLFKLEVLNSFIRNVVNKDVFITSSLNPELANYKNLTIQSEAFILDDNLEYTRSVINICGFYYDCPLNMSVDEYIVLYITSLISLLKIELGNDFETKTKEMCSKMLEENKEVVRSRKKGDTNETQ